jgi:hypothetical protein
VDQDRLHAERVGDEAGVLTARAAEGVQEVARHVMAALDADLLYRVGHVLDGDADEAFGDLLGAAAVAGLRRDRLEPRGDDVAIERLVAPRAEDRGEEPGIELAEHHVGVGDGQRPAAAIAGRAGIGAGGVGADAEAAGLGVEDRAAAGGDGVDAHHGRAHPHARDLRVEGALEVAGEVRDVRRGAAHVEADDLAKAGALRRAGHPDDAARRSRQDRVLALEAVGRGEAARGHHELKGRPGLAGRRRAQRLRHAGDVAAQDRGKIGVDHGGVAAPDELDERRDLVTDGDLAEAPPAHLRGERRLMRRVAPSVHQHDRHRVDPGPREGSASGASSGPRSSGISTEPSARSRSSTSITRS